MTETTDNTHKGGLVYAGTPDFAVPALESLLVSGYRIRGVYTQPDRPSGRGRKASQSPVKQIALKAGVPVFQPADFRDPLVLEALKEMSPDIMVVAAYGILLPKAVLNIPRLGCINIHASLLPRWRGAAPIQRAIQAGDSETGVTLMQMSSGLDKGDILAQKAVSIHLDDTAQTLHDRLAHAGAQLLLQKLPAILDRQVVPEPQDNRLATYAEKLSKAEGEIDWTWPASRIERDIRAFYPWPGSYTLWRGQPLRIGKVETIPVSHGYPPGSVINLSTDGIDVATGEGVLRLLTVQPAGKKWMTASAFINGYHPGFVRFPQQSA